MNTEDRTHTATRKKAVVAIGISIALVAANLLYGWRQEWVEESSVFTLRPRQNVGNCLKSPDQKDAHHYNFLTSFVLLKAQKHEHIAEDPTHEETQVGLLRGIFKTRR